MAYAISPEDQQQQNQQPGTPGAPGTAATQPVTTSAAPGAGPSGSKTPTGAPNQQAPAQPFTNLQSYLTANAPQVQQEANTVSGNLTNQYGQVQGDIANASNNFTGQVAAGFTPENPQIVGQATANPAQFVETPGNVAAFQSQINDAYTGPANFEGTAGYAPLNAEVTQDAANANLVNTPAGLQTYLEGSETNPTQGENLLDATLLGANPQAIQQVQQAASPFSQLPTYLSNAVTAEDALAGAAPGAAQQAATDAGTAITGTENTFNTNLANEVSQAEGQVNAANQTIGQDQQALNPLEAAYQAYLGGGGFGAGDIVSPLLSQASVAMPSEAQIASASDYAENAALEQLMGTVYSPQLSDANASQAGTFQAPNVSAYNPQTIAQELADQNTQATFTQQDAPNIQGLLNVLEGTGKGGPGNAGIHDPAETPAFEAKAESDLAAKNPTSQSQVLANSGIPNIPNFYGNFNPKALETLLAYLQTVDPSGISQQGSDYIVNS